MTTPELSTSPIGLHRVLEPSDVLPQAAWRVDNSNEARGDEIRIKVEVLNLDAASYHQLKTEHCPATGIDAPAMRTAVTKIVAERGKMQNPVTGSGGMLIGVIDQIGPQASTDFKVGDRVATLVSLSLTPLMIHDGLEQWDGASERVPTDAHAIVFGKTIMAALPDDLPAELALMVMDVCGAPALVTRELSRLRAAGLPPTVAIVGAAGKSGSLAAAAARAAGATNVVGIVPVAAEEELLRHSGLCDHVVLADARNPVQVASKVTEALGQQAALTVVCVDVPGCEHGAILCTQDGGSVIYFSMATSFSAAALGAEGLAADVTMIVGNGYVPGHAELAMDLLRNTPAVRALFESRLAVMG